MLRRPPFVWLVVLLCAVYSALFMWAAVVSVRYYGMVKAPGWTARATNDGWFVTIVDPVGGAAAQLESDDRLLALGGDRRAAVLGPRLIDNIPGGSSYRVEVERGGRHVSTNLTMTVVRGQLLWPVFQLIGLAFFLCGASLALLRPNDPQVRLVGGTLMAVAFTTLLEADDPARRFIATAGDRGVQLAIASLALFTFPMAYHVFSRFPAWTSPGRLWRGVQWLLYALLALVFAPAWVLNYAGYDVTPGLSRFLVSHPTLFLSAVQLSAQPAFAYIGTCLLLAMVAAARNYRRLTDPGSRRRIRLVVAGLMIGCVPYVVIVVFTRVFAFIDDATFRFWYPVAFVSMLSIPASMTAAVWKEQLFDIRVLVRRGLQYLFARAALRTLLALPIVVLAFSILSHPDRTIGQVLTQGSGWINIALVGAAAVALRSRQRLQMLLDRRFFREAYEQEQVLVNLIDEVRRCDSPRDVAGLVSARVDSVLHPASLHIFYRAQERSDRFDGHSSSRMITGAELSGQPSLLRLLDADRAIRDVPAGVEGLPDAEREWLTTLSVRLIVPIAGAREGLIGVLLLGERKSEEPYSVTDRRLLQGLAAQIGLLYENQHMQERIRHDADVRRDVLARLDERRIALLKECPRCGRCFDSTSERCESDGAELILTLPIERTLDGKYRLERALGRGGFGAVYEAEDLRLRRKVAAKVMMGSLFGDQTALRRFEREARAAAKIDHPHITRVHDYGTVGSGGAFLIMELVAGRTWREELRRSAAIAPARAAEWFRQLLDGLQFAHAMGVVHRDLKPENVMLVSVSGDDRVKIMDFGLAKVLEAGAGVTEWVSVAGTAMGTIGYMAPEALTGGPVDERVDIFAVGVMVVETVTGHRPFTGQTVEQSLAALLHGEYHLPGASAETRRLDAIVQRCIARDPRDRHGSAAELAIDLIPALTSCAVWSAPEGAAVTDAPTLG